MRRELIVITLAVITAACTPSSSPSNPPATLTTTSSTATTLMPQSPLALSEDLAAVAAFPNPATVGGVIEICAGVPWDEAEAVVLSTRDGSHRRELTVDTSQDGVVSTCWETTIPRLLDAAQSSASTLTGVDTNTYAIHVVNGSTIIASGAIEIVDELQPKESALTWPSDTALIGQPVPVAISNAHGAGYAVEVHGDISGTVETAIPQQWRGSHGETVHLWARSGSAVEPEAYELFSTSLGNIMYRHFDLEWELSWIEEALDSSLPPAMPRAMRLAALEMQGLTPYVHIVESHDADWSSSNPVSELRLMDPSNGHIYNLRLLDDARGAGERSEWVFEDPEVSDHHARVSASNGLYRTALVVFPRHIMTDDSELEDPGPLLVGADDVRSMLEQVTARWDDPYDCIKVGSTKPCSPPDVLDGYETHRSLRWRIIRNADHRLHGPFVTIDWTAEEAPEENQVPVVAGDGTYPWVTFYSAFEGSDILSGQEYTVDLGGQTALFRTDSATWFFCLDTAFSINSNAEFVSELASQICTAPGNIPLG